MPKRRAIHVGIVVFIRLRLVSMSSGIWWLEVLKGTQGSPEGWRVFLFLHRESQGGRYVMGSLLCPMPGLVMG